MSFRQFRIVEYSDGTYMPEVRGSGESEVWVDAALSICRSEAEALKCIEGLKEFQAEKDRQASRRIKSIIPIE